MNIMIDRKLCIVHNRHKNANEAKTRGGSALEKYRALKHGWFNNTDVNLIIPLCSSTTTLVLLLTRSNLCSAVQMKEDLCTLKKGCHESLLYVHAPPDPLDFENDFESLRTGTSHWTYRLFICICKTGPMLKTVELTNYLVKIKLCYCLSLFHFNVYS